MMAKNIRFEKDGGLYKLFYNSGSKEYDMGISFITEHNIEDYPITILEQINGRDCYLTPCKDVIIKLLNPPEKTKRIEIARDADIKFAGDFILGIEKSLRIETNKETAFSFALSSDENPNKEKFIKFKELEISRNNNAAFYFSKSNIERKIDSSLLNSMPKKVSEIKNNKDIFFSLRDDIKGLDLKNNSYDGDNCRGEIVCDSLYASLDSLEIIEDVSLDDAASLILSADAVFAINSKFEIAEALKIKNKGTKSIGGSKLSISSSNIEKPNYSDRDEEAVFEVDCDHLQINSNRTLIIFGKKMECLGGKIVIDSTGDNISEPLRLDNSESFFPEQGEVNIRRIESQDSSLTLVPSEDNKYSIKRAYLNNGEAKNISGDIYLYAENCKIDGIVFENNSGIVLTTDAPNREGITTFVVENTLLKKDSSLEVKDTKSKGAHVKLSNVMAEGEVRLVSGLDVTMEKSILAKGATYLISNDEGLKISNSIIQGGNTIEGVISIVNSKIENSFISGENVIIKDEEMVKISDYKEYIKYKTKDGLVATNQIERL